LKVRKPPLLPQVAAHAQIACHGSLPAKPECRSRKPSGYWLIGFCLLPCRKPRWLQASGRTARHRQPNYAGGSTSISPPLLSPLTSRRMAIAISTQCRGASQQSALREYQERGPRRAGRLVANPSLPETTAARSRRRSVTSAGPSWATTRPGRSRRRRKCGAPPSAQPGKRAYGAPAGVAPAILT
jgi:hypothetical protein